MDVKTWSGAASAVVYMGETVDAFGTITRKWRSANPVTAAPQFFRLKASMP
jgi:hypothetical protein